MLIYIKWCTVLSLAATLIISGCAMTITPATGFIYSDVDGPWIATSNSGASKSGQSECMSILGLVAVGDASIEAAMRDGGISRVHHVDYDAFNILSVYARLTVTVYGE